MKVYWSSIENKYDAPKSKLMGGFVYAFVNGANSVDALDKIFQKLKGEHKTPKKVKFTKQYDPSTQWENEKQTKHYLNLYASAEHAKTVFMDDYYAYEKNK